MYAATARRASSLHAIKAGELARLQAKARATARRQRRLSAMSDTQASENEQTEEESDSVELPARSFGMRGREPSTSGSESVDTVTKRVDKIIAVGYSLKGTPSIC